MYLMHGGAPSTLAVDGAGAASKLAASALDAAAARRLRHTAQSLQDGTGPCPGKLLDKVHGFGTPPPTHFKGHHDPAGSETGLRHAVARAQPGPRVRGHGCNRGDKTTKIRGRRSSSNVSRGTNAGRGLGLDRHGIVQLQGVPINEGFRTACAAHGRGNGRRTGHGRSARTLASGTRLLNRSPPAKRDQGKQGKHPHFCSGMAGGPA